MILWLKQKIQKKIYRTITDRPISNPLIKKFDFINKSPTYFVKNFGNKNKDKIFYVIKLYETNKEGGGLFSMVLFVLNHLKIVEKNNYIPVVDFENFYNRYNEEKPVNKIKNSWLYYFEQLSKYRLSEVYNSKNVIMTHGYFSKDMALEFVVDKEFRRIFLKYIKIRKKYLDNANKFYKFNLKNNKVLGIHFRGTDRQTGVNHPLPPTLTQMYHLADIALKKYKFNKIFLVTDSLYYLEKFKKKYKSILCYRKESFRSNQSKIFHLKVRKNHRYEIGRDNIEEMLMLSKINYLICSKSNLSQTAVMLSGKKYNVMEIENGKNSKRLIFAIVKFKFLSLLPEFLGGFNKKIPIKFKKISYKKNL